MLALDASYLVAVLTTSASLPDDDLVAPPLLWSETRSALHQLVRRGIAPRNAAREIADGLASLPIRRFDDERVGPEAWRISDELGWARTYDAEYVAVASLLGCRLLTTDGRLRREADRLGLVITPDEL